MTGPLGSLLTVGVAMSLGLTALFPVGASAQAPPTVQLPPQSSPTSEGQTADDYNQRFRQLLQQFDIPNTTAAVQDYRIGPEDLLENLSLWGAGFEWGSARRRGRFDLRTPGWDRSGCRTYLQRIGICTPRTPAPDLYEGSARKCLREGSGKPFCLSVWCGGETWRFSNSKCEVPDRSAIHGAGAG